MPARYGNMSVPRSPKPRKINQPASTKTAYGPGGKDTVSLSNNVVDFANENGLGYYEQTGDAATRYHREALVRLERQLDDQNLVYSTIKDRMCSNLLGPKGFTLQARTGSDAINEYIEKVLWPEFTTNPEYRELFSWKECQYMAMREIIGPGDCGFVKLSAGQIQAVEGELISTPQRDKSRQVATDRKIEQGIELTNGGKYLGVYITQPDQSGYSLSSQGRRIDKRNFIYCGGKIQRFSRTRPIPPFIQIASSIWRLDDILNSEAVCWQLLAKHALIINQESAEQNAYDLSVGDDYNESGTGQVQDRVTTHDAGTIFWGEPGETVSGVDRNLPGKDFPQSVRAFMQLFAMRYGFPLEILMLDWTKTNFASGKAALTQATQMIREWQVRLVEQFHQQIYEWKIRQWVEAGLIPDLPDIANHEWFPPIPPWVDPESEANSRGIQIDRGIITYSNMLKQDGKDRDTQNEERAADIQAAIDKANELNAKNPGSNVSWKIFAGYAEGKTEAAFKESGNSNSGGADDGEPEQQ